MGKNYLVPHIFDGNAFDWFEVGVSALNEDPVNAFILAVDEQLGKDDNVLRVAGTVRDLSRCKKKIESSESSLQCKLGRITRPPLAIRQKLAASENIRVWTYEKRPRVIRLESESNTCILDEYGEY